MICLYEKNETNFTFNGLGTLEPTECSFLPSINGVWSLKMTLPVDSEGKSNLIKNDRLIKVTDIDCIDAQTSDYQLFRIYDFRKEQNYVYVTALPVGLDARFDTFVESLKLYDKTVAEAITAINSWLSQNPGNRYTVEAYGGFDSSKHSGEYTRANLISVLNGDNGFVQIWGGELCYDNYKVKVNKRLGKSTPLDVRYGKNILGMEYDMDASNVITRLYPKAKSGEILNGVADYSIGILPTPYVDADNASDYPIDHIYAVDAPYNLVQLSNDGSAEYLDSQNLFDAIMQTTRFWLHTGLLNSTSGYYTSAPLLEDVELDWIINNYALTTEKDGVEGIVEHMWRQIITNSTHNIVSKSVQNLIYSAMKAAFDEVLTDDESGWYIGASSKKLWEDGFGQYFYSYTWDAGGQFRVNGNGTDYAWVYANSKWNQLNSSGTTTGATDKTTWKWYKVKNKKWKRYGNKKKSRYLHHQTWKINDVWYWFKNDGEPQKGSALYNEWILFFDNKAVAYEQGVEPATLYGALIPICTDGERLLFQRLYNRMTEYCEELFDANKLSYPTISIDINIADLSQTEEYKDYQNLEKIHLGDTVNVRNDKLGVPFLTERIIGLTYDVLRKCNTEIRIGLTESSVVNLLNSIGKTDNQTKYVAGEGITIENNVISVNPPETPYLEDVLLDGETVVRNHKAYLDSSLLGLGLQWFEETEESLYGMETQVDALAENPKFYVDHPITMHIDNVEEYGSKYNYYFKSTNTDSSVIACGYEGVIIDTMYNPPDWDDGFLVISKNQNTASIEYWNNEVTHQTYNWSSTTETRQQLNWTTCEGYGMSTTFSYEGETYYAVLVCSNNKALWTREYEVDKEIGWNTDYKAYWGEYDTFADFAIDVLTANISVDKYNGISRDDKLAFFAGAEDELGTNAKVKIWTDGKTQGLVADATYNGNSVVDENGVAILDDIGGGSEVSITPTLQSGTKIADYEIDGVTGELYAPRGMTTGLAWRSLSEADYEALSTAEKNNGTIYFVSDDIAELEGKTYIYISQTEYDNLTSAEKNNGIPYFVYRG